MAFPESSEWTIEGKEAAEFLNKLFQTKEERKLVTDTKLSPDELHNKVVANARKRKNKK